MPKVRILPYLGPRDGDEKHRIDLDSLQWDTEKMTERWLQGWPDRRAARKPAKDGRKAGFYLGHRGRKAKDEEE